MRPEAEGIVYPPVPFRVDPARVRDFGTVFGADGVFPTFPTAAEFSVFPDVLDDPRLDLDFARVVHGTQEYVFERPLREGESSRSTCGSNPRRFERGRGSSRS